MTGYTKSRIRVPPDVLVSDVGGESVFLNLKTESYFGLDDVGTRMWKLLTEGGTVESAYQALLTEYDIDEAQLSNDLDELVQKLVDNGLVEVVVE
jgi:hypothetical protein